jgi:hypothetical protein
MGHNMDDIVKRLRSEIATIYPRAVTLDAADEIEKLRESVSALHREMYARDAEIRRLEAEIKRP